MRLQQGRFFDMSENDHTTADDGEITAIGRAFKRRLPLLVLVSCLAAAATYGVLGTIAPRFEAQAELTIIAQGSGDGGLESITTRMDREAINTHVKVLSSPDLGNRIAADLNLAARPEFNSALGPIDAWTDALHMAGLGGLSKGETAQDRVLATYLKQLDVYSAKESRFIGIRFTSIDAQLAADVANRIAEEYRSMLASQNISEIDGVQKALQAKIDKLILEAADAEASVERFRGQVNIFKGASNAGLNEQQLGDLTSEVTRASAARSEAEARARAAREMLKVGSADALPDVQKSPLMQALAQQRVGIERQISELSTTLLPGHPRMRQLKADLDGLRRQIDGEATKVVTSLEKEAKVAAMREESIRKSLDEIKARVVDKGPDEAKLRQLEAVARTKRNELDSLQAQFESNRKRVDSRIVPVEAKIISRARAASMPSYPKKGSTAALVFVAVFMFGAASVFLSALVSARQADQKQSGERVASRRSAPDIPAHEVPSWREAPARPMAAAVVEVDLPLAAPEVAALLGEVVVDAGGHRILVAGEIPRINAANDALALAECLAADGAPTVVIDWAPAGEGLADALGVATAPGLGELIHGEAAFDDVITSLPRGRAHIVRRGTGLDDAGDIDPDQLNMVLDALDEVYANIVFAGANHELVSLFVVTEGRVDSAVLVNFAGEEPATADAKIFGFDVADIRIVRMQHAAEHAAAPAVTPAHLGSAPRLPRDRIQAALRA